jgi:hypothetical protein
MNFSVTGIQFGLGIIGIGVLIIIFIFLSKYRISHTKIHHHIKNRLVKKYEEADVLKLSGTFWRIGLIAAVGLTILAFGWTTYDTTIDVNG